MTMNTETWDDTDARYCATRVEDTMSPRGWYYFVAQTIAANQPMTFASLAKIARRTKGTARGLRSAYDMYMAEVAS
jgi:hypothetical protein